LEAGYEFVDPSPASQEEIRKVHGLQHIELVRSRGLYECRSSCRRRSHRRSEAGAAGRARLRTRAPARASRSCNRPGECVTSTIWPWLCRNQAKGKAFLIIDIDLHYGDGTATIFRETQMSRSSTRGRLMRTSSIRHG